MPIHLPVRIPGTRRIAFVADASDSSTQVLSHAARHTLATVLAAHGASLEEALVASLLDGRVDANNVRWQSEHMQSGIARTLEALASYAPNIVVCLGNDPRSPSHAALHLFKGGNVAPPATKSGKVRWAWSTSVWRGSLFTSSPLPYQPISMSSKEAARDARKVASLEPATVAGGGGLVASAHDKATGAGSCKGSLDATGREQREQANHAVKLNRQVQDGERPSTTFAHASEVVHPSACPPGESPAVRAFLQCADKPLVGILEVPVVLEERAPEQHIAVNLPVRQPYKCLATWHPSFVNRAWGHYLFEFRSDLRRAVEEALSPALTLETFDLVFGPAND